MSSRGGGDGRPTGRRLRTVGIISGCLIGVFVLSGGIGAVSVPLDYLSFEDNITVGSGIEEPEQVSGGADSDQGGNSSGGGPAIRTESSERADAPSVGDQTAIDRYVRDNETVHFVVEANESAYWRLVAYNSYDGTGWDRTESSPVHNDPPEGRSRELLFQEVTLRIPSAVVPTSLRPVDPPASATYGGESGLVLNESAEPGDSFSVVSLLPETDARALNESEARYPDAIERRYTDSSDVPERVSERAAEITESATTPYETAITLDAWFESNYEHANNTTISGEQVVSELLFERERGHSGQFATAMAVLLQTQGIPARYTKGYVGGEFEPDNGTYVVSNRHIHDWVEVYFTGHGWVPFDPTPSKWRETRTVTGAPNHIVTPGREFNLPFFDTRVQSVRPPVMAGDELNVTVSVTNTGDVEGTQTVELGAGALGNRSTEVTLDAGESLNRTLVVETGTGDAGNYTVRVNTTDNRSHDPDTEMVQVHEESFDVEIAGTNAPVTEGETVEVTAEITSTGTEGTRTVKLNAGRLGNTSSTVTLDSGESTTETLRVNTKAGDAGSVVATVEGNNTVSVPVQVNDSGSGENGTSGGNGGEGGEGEGGEDGQQGEDGQGEGDQDGDGSQQDEDGEDGQQDEGGEGEGGEDGEGGESGEDGEGGEDGRQGEGGEDGEGGRQGEGGEDGEDGQQGERGGGGEGGQQGEDGKQGNESGESGEDGQQGESGEDGQQGESGEDNQEGEESQQGEGDNSEETEKAFFEITIAGTNSPVFEGKRLNVTANITNTGGVEGTQTVQLGAGALGNDSAEVTLDGGRSTTERLSIETSPGAAGTYTATVQTGDPNHDPDSKTVQVREDDRTYRIELLSEAVPGRALPVEVLGDDDPVANVQVVVGNVTAGTTNESGVATVTVPFEETMTIEAYPETRDTETPAATRNVSLPTDINLTVEGAVHARGSVTLTTMINGHPVEGGYVRAADQLIQRTDETGVARFDLPDRTGNVTIAVERGAAEGRTEVDIPPVSVSVTAWPAVLPGRDATVNVTHGTGHPVANVPVMIDGEQVATTDENGTATVTPGAALSADVTAERGQWQARATVRPIANLLLGLGPVAVLLLVAGGVARRRGRRPLQFVLTATFSTLLSALIALSRYVDRLADRRPNPDITIGEATPFRGSNSDDSGPGAPRTAVRRAWRTVLSLAPVDRPQTKTPGHIADRAIEAGLPARPVRTILRRFRAVEYGNRAADEETDTAVQDAAETIQQRDGEDR